MVKYTLKIIFYYFVILYPFLNAYSQNSTQDQVQQEYGDVQNVPTDTVSQSTKSDDIIIKNVNQTYYSQTVSPDGYTKAVLTGNVHIIYSKKDIYADEMVIKFLGGKAQVLIAKGNVLLKSKDRTTIAREIFIYLESKNIQFLDPITLQNNIYVRGLGLRYNNKDLTTLQDVSMTTSTKYIPRYTLNASSGWVEQDNDLILLNAYLQVGQDPVIYFPIFYNNHYGTGIITNITYDAYLGFMIFNTFSQKTDVDNEKLMLDYYQKLGIYLGNDFTKTDIGNLETHIGIAYDYHARYNPNTGQVENVFEQILGEGPSVGRSLRYNLSLSYDKQIFQSENSDGFNLRYKGTYKELSDPNFVNEFETTRYDQFDLKSLFFSDNEGYQRAQSDSMFGGTEGRRIDNSIIMGWNGYSLQISSSLLYSLNPNNTAPNVNSFSPSYWQNKISQESIPQIDFLKSFLIYTVQQDFEDDSKLNIPIKFDINYNFQNLSQFQPEGLKNQNLINKVRGTFSSNITYSTAEIFNLYFPLSLEDTFSYDQGSYYDEKQNSVWSSSRNLLTNGLAANYSPELKFRVLDNSNFINTTTLKTTYNNNRQHSKNIDPTASNTDSTSNFNGLIQNAGDTVHFEWVEEDWDYLSGYVESGYTYTYQNKNGDMLAKDNWENSIIHAAVIKANFFKTTVELSSSNQYGTKITPENTLQPLRLRIDSTAIPFVTLSDTYQWDRYYKIQQDNNFNFTTSIPSRVNLASWLWFSSVDININVVNNFKNPILDYLNYKFSLLFNITELWQLEFFLTGNNQQLYLYGDSAPKSQKKNFFLDLLKSFAFWSNSARQESSFKMQKFGINISHDLDEWVLRAGASLAPNVTSGTFYFDTQFYIEVILKDLGMLSAPKIEQGSDNGTQY